MGDQVDGIHALVLLQDIADLRDAVAVVVEQDDLEAPALVASGAQVVEQLLVVRHIGVDEHQFQARRFLRQGRGQRRAFVTGLAAE